ncbi:hypothetical protein HZU77_004895 [Neisseriaceae bacterium TC5R-5]|nr:hypothetical protein [Neisseriaceae bacterium TC5R-5]
MSQASQDEGISIVMSAPQLAAALARKTLSQGDILSNRFWGSLELAGGILEMVGAGALCIAPEPTGATKVGCVAIGAHGADTIATGARKVWTGEDSRSLTQQGVIKLAETMKANPSQAGNIAIAVDMSVPIGLASMVNAARVSSITLGRFRISEHEAKSLGGRGGHTLAKHVGQTKEEMLARLEKEKDLFKVSSFYSRKLAEWGVSEVLLKRSSEISSWAKSSSTRPLEIEEAVGKVVGHGINRGKDNFKEIYNGMPYFVLTAYPK